MKHIKFQTASSVLLFFVSSCFPGCSFMETKSISLHLPENPSLKNVSTKLEISAWQIEYPEYIEDGLPVYTLETITNESLNEAAVPVIRIARGINLPVLARPVFSVPLPDSTEVLPLVSDFPAGSVYPADIESGMLKLNWEDGFASMLLKRCLLNSDILQGFDSLRFRAAISEKAAELSVADGDYPAEQPPPGGVWLLDSDTIISRLGYGMFRESSIKAAETMSFDIPAAAGIWLSDNPFYPPVNVSPDRSNPEDGILSVVVPQGLKTVFIQPDSAGMIEVYFNEKMWCWVNMTTGASESGRM